jgi:thymidylate synthase
MPNFTTLDELVKTKTSDYKLIDYNPMDTIKAPMAV